MYTGACSNRASGSEIAGACDVHSWLYMVTKAIIYSALFNTRAQTLYPPLSRLSPSYISPLRLRLDEPIAPHRRLLILTAAGTSGKMSANKRSKTGIWGDPAFLQDLVMCFYLAGTEARVMTPEVRKDIEGAHENLGSSGYVGWHPVNQDFL